ELADLRADVRRVGIEQVRGEAYGLDAGVERALELAALALVLHQLPGLRALEVLIPFAHQGEDRSECVGEVKARRRRVVLLERLLGTRSQRALTLTFVRLRHAPTRELLQQRRPARHEVAEIVGEVGVESLCERLR